MFKKFIKSLIITVAFLGLSVSPALAITPTVTITNLPDYVRENTFYISYSALADDPGTITAQFSVKKEGGSYTPFGGIQTGASGRVQVTSSQVNESNKKYYFKVTISSSNGGATSSETEATFDNTSPSGVGNYSKEVVSPGFYRLHWTNPGDSDFSRVFIYRSDSPDFTADGSTKIAERGGAPDADVTYDDSSLDPNKTYYYALIAVDNAGNASGVVADAEANVEVGQVEGASTQSESQVTILPKTQSNGQVLGEEANGASPLPAPESSPSTLGQNTQAASNFLNSTTGKIIVGGFLALLGIYLFFRGRRNY